ERITGRQMAGGRRAEGQGPRVSGWRSANIIQKTLTAGSRRILQKTSGCFGSPGGGMADAADLKSAGPKGRGGSSPPLGTLRHLQVRPARDLTKMYRKTDRAARSSCVLRKSWNCRCHVESFQRYDDHRRGGDPAG